MKGREQEFERKVGNSSVFKRKKIHGNQHTSSNLSSQPNPESTKTPLTGASRSYKSRVSQILNFTTQSSKEATNRFARIFQITKTRNVTFVLTFSQGANPAKVTKI